MNVSSRLFCFLNEKILRVKEISGQDCSPLNILIYLVIVFAICTVFKRRSVPPLSKQKKQNTQRLNSRITEQNILEQIMIRFKILILLWLKVKCLVSLVQSVLESQPCSISFWTKQFKLEAHVSLPRSAIDYSLLNVYNGFIVNFNCTSRALDIRRICS